ncbi:MAG: glycine cleavage system protein T, partial [Solirubrobacterales bacterium]|nr:glycine cleavage system protein T [Solirubrobacterales bacterium]
PIGAGLGWAVKEDTGFIGSEAIAAVRKAGPKQKLVPFLIEGRGIARQGDEVKGGGVVTSGSFSPSLERGVGLAYVSAEQAEAGTPFQINVRGTLRDAVVAKKPLYRKDA